MTFDEVSLTLAHKYGGGWTLRGDGYDGLEWHRDEPKPSLAELQAALPEALAAQQFERARRNRQSLFRELSDPIFFDWQRGKATEQDWQDAVDRIKTEHPYPEV